MLEVRNLKKIYKSKKSSDTEALADISLKLGDTGLVFVLGKSGSGKSTFLNVLGGLDSFDGGEIIINGRSSKDFNASDFDSYRNTFLGFVFQDFNILEGFSVGKNISLALQLQDSKVDEDAVADILRQVDLEGYEDRKPNELSGGQKQRVAIARALIKNPSVIFADEPTGALDSQTGRQVFQTLKKLSSDKLIVVVSHDKDFAEEFGDRIIELKDGRVISDVTRNERKSGYRAEIEIIDEKIIKLPKGFHLTTEHIDKINKIIDVSKADTYLSVNDFKSLQKAFPDKVKKYEKDETIVDYIPTNQDEIVETRETREMIKSKLPARDAMKIAFSNFKAKKFRLVLTLFLSVLALSFFGFATILSDYDKDMSYTKTFYEGDAYLMSINKTENIGNNNNSSNIISVDFKTADINSLTSRFSNNLIYSYNIEDFVSSKYLNSTQLIKDTEIFEASTHPIIKPTAFTGILDDQNETLEIAYGSRPLKDNECAISDLFADYFILNGMRIGMENGSIVKVTCDNYDQVLNKVITVGSKKYTITGIFKTNYYTYNDAFAQLSLEKIMGSNELALKTQNYNADYQLYMSKILVANGYADVFKKQLTSYDANLFIDIPNAENKLGASVEKDMRKELKQGEVTLSALYYRNVKYGFSSTRTFEQLESDFSDSQSFNFYVKASSNDGVKSQIYLNNLTVVGIYDDLDVLGEPIIVMNSTDFDEMLDQIYLPTNVLVSATKSGDELNTMISSLHEEDYEVSCRSEENLKTIGDIMVQLTQVFFLASAVLAFFVTLLLFNFISASIANKKKEIGILRAIGARGVDVMKIFVFEGLMIALLIILFSVPIVAYGSGLINSYMLSVLPVVLVSFSFKQVIGISALTLFIILLSSFFPVRSIAKKKPIDAIKDK